MRRIRVTAEKGLLQGNRWYNQGEIIDHPDDKRAAAIVAEGNAELVVSMPGLDLHASPANTATAPKPPEKAARR